MIPDLPIIGLAILDASGFKGLRRGAPERSGVHGSTYKCSSMRLPGEIQ